MILSIFFGLICGVTLGLTGGGGSILTVPMLVYGIGVPFHEAVTMSLLVVGLTALIGAIPHIRDKEIDFSAGIIMAIAGMICAPVGNYIGSFLNGHILMALFAILMFVMGIWSWLKARNEQLLARKHQVRVTQNSQPYRHSSHFQLIFALTGAFTGVLTGIFGVGGGFLIVPALLLAAKMPIEKAISTSLMIIFLIATSGFVAHLHSMTIDWHTTLWFVLGGAVGVSAANLVKHKLHGDTLHKLFAVVIVLFAIWILIKTLL